MTWNIREILGESISLPHLHSLAVYAPSLHLPFVFVRALIIFLIGKKVAILYFFLSSSLTAQIPWEMANTSYH